MSYKFKPRYINDSILVNPDNIAECIDGLYTIYKETSNTIHEIAHAALDKDIDMTVDAVEEAVLDSAIIAMALLESVLTYFDDSDVKDAINDLEERYAASKKKHDMIDQLMEAVDSIMGRRED